MTQDRLDLGLPATDDDSPTYYWRIRTKLPDRWHHQCRIVCRGKRNSILIEFADGLRVVTSGNYIRRWPPPPPKP